jgi:hypothetical protein
LRPAIAACEIRRTTTKVVREAASVSSENTVPTTVRNAMHSNAKR